MFNIVTCDSKGLEFKKGSIVDFSFKANSKEHYRGKFSGITKEGKVIFKNVSVYHKGRFTLLSTDMHIPIYEIYICTSDRVSRAVLQEDKTK